MATTTYTIPATYWDDYSDRSPVDSWDQMAVEVSRSGSRVTITATPEQREYLLGDARFYADPTAHDTDWPTLTRGAKRVVEILTTTPA